MTTEDPESGVQTPQEQPKEIEWKSVSLGGEVASPALSAPVAKTPMEMLAFAVQQGADIDKIERLMDLEARWKADKAREAFLRAKAAFKKDPPVVIKDMKNEQYGSRYSSLANLVNTVNEALAAHDLDASWDHHQNRETGEIGVTCILKHKSGHSEEVTLWGPPDASGSKNDLQKIKSTLTYLKGATFEAVTGIASRAGNADDDGRGADPAETLLPEEVSTIKRLIDEAGVEPTKFLAWAEADSVEAVLRVRFNDAVRMLKRRKETKT